MFPMPFKWVKIKIYISQFIQIWCNHIFQLRKNVFINFYIHTNKNLTNKIDKNVKKYVKKRFIYAYLLKHK